MMIESLSTTFYVSEPMKSAAFYVDCFDFRIVFGNDWFVSLQHPSDPRFDLCFITRGHAKIPAPFNAQEPAGTLLGWLVDDADRWRERLENAGVPMVTDVVDEPYGQRHFFCRDPDGVLIDVVQRIPIDEAWLEGERQAGAVGV